MILLEIIDIYVFKQIVLFLRHHLATFQDKI